MIIFITLILSKISVPNGNYIKMANIERSIAPGIPNIPTTKVVTRFIPICSPHIPPIRLIKYSRIAPNTELIISFAIIFIGTINIFPKMKIPIIHAIYISNILVSIIYLIPSTWHESG